MEILNKACITSRKAAIVYTWSLPHVSKEKVSECMLIAIKILQKNEV